jgi:putative ABC transport system permease protein
MESPRWRKVLSDLWGNKIRTLLVALSIGVGVFAVGVVAGSFIILKTDIPIAFNAANPHSAVIAADPFDDDMIEAVKDIEGVGKVEGRTAVSGQVEIEGGQKVAIRVTAIPALEQQQVDKVFLEQGSPVLGDKEIYLERTALAALRVQPGDSVTMLLQDGRARELRVAGIVYDVWGTPFNISRSVSAYSSLETIEWLGGSRLYTNLLIKTEKSDTDEAYVRNVASRVADKVSRGGREVYITVIFRPGQHPAQQTIDTVLSLLGAMGLLAVFLSAFLVINTINALLAQQVRLIGVMKAIGAAMDQVAGMYLVLILAFGMVALLIAIPLSGAAAYLLATAVAQLLNIDLAGFRIPTEALVIEVAVGITIPLFGGLIPVLNGARMTVREAISSYGFTTGGSRSFLDMVLESVRGLPRPLLISLRNTFRRKGRLALTLFTLVLGGAIFIGVFNVRDGLFRAIEATFGYFLSDVNVDFGRSYRMERIDAAIADVPGIVSTEGWAQSNVQALRPGGITGDDVFLFAPPANSKLIDPVMTAGRWLVPEDENAIVIGNHFVKLRPDVGVGDVVRLRIEGKDSPFQVVGVYQMAGNVVSPIVYTNFEHLANLRNEAGQIDTLRVVTDSHDFSRQEEVAKAIEMRFNEEGFVVGGILTGSQTIQQQRVTIDVLVYLLLFMAVLIAVVGGLGLMGTMSMNVLERTREIGVMRSIGAVNMAIMQLVIVEGLIIGLISWAFGALLSIPIGRGLNNIIGTSLLNVPMDYSFSLEGLIIWAVVVLVLSAIACIIPARNAVRLTVRDVLAYE